MTDLTRLPSIRSREEYEAAKARLIRLKEDSDETSDFGADIEALRNAIEQYENDLRAFAMDAYEADPHEVLGI